MIKSAFFSAAALALCGCETTWAVLDATLGSVDGAAYAGSSGFWADAIGKGEDEYEAVRAAVSFASQGGYRPVTGAPDRLECSYIPDADIHMCTGEVYVFDPNAASASYGQTPRPTSTIVPRGSGAILQGTR